MANVNPWMFAACICLLLSGCAFLELACDMRSVKLPVWRVWRLVGIAFVLTSIACGILSFKYGG